MTNASRTIVLGTAAALLLFLSVCFLNYWLSLRAVDDLLRSELAQRNATALDFSGTAVAAHSAAIGELRRGLLINSTISVIVVAGAVVGLGLVLGRRSRSLQRVNEGARAIADGELDQSLFTSRDDMQLFAASVNTLSAKLREQLEREAESRQFDSFVHLAAMLAHDLKNAIHGLSMLVENMDRFGDREDFRAEAMTALKQETAKLQRLVNRLSDPVNTRSGEHGLPLPTDLVPIMQRLAKAAVNPPHQAELDLPETIIAIVDAERIEKVIENLLLNACEAMGQQPGMVRLAAGITEKGSIFLTVSDTGPGISEEFQRKRLFHAFATTKQRGLGLGLYTCREAVNAHGGKINVESKPGAGTTFRVVLPCAPS